MKRMIALIALALLAAPALRADQPDYLALEDIPTRFQEMSDRGWGLFGGFVMVGKLERPTDAKVASRITFREDGSYSLALHKTRQLVFHAHGYDPLRVFSTNMFSAGVIDAGGVSFSKAAPENLRILRSKIITENDSTPIHARLVIQNEDYVWDDHGYECGAAVSVLVKKWTFKGSGQIHMEGLSRAPYRLIISAPGHITQTLPIDPAADKIVEYDLLPLTKAPRYEITYRSRVRHDGGPWKTDVKSKTATITCDGDARFAFTNERDGLGNSLELRMKPKNEGVETSFFFWGQDTFRPLESVTLIDADFDALDMETTTGSALVILKDGATYLFRKHDVNGTDIELLFTPRAL